MTHGPTVVVGGAIIMLAMLSLSQKRQLETQGKLLTDWEDVIDSQNSLIKQLASRIAAWKFSRGEMHGRPA